MFNRNLFKAKCVEKGIPIEKIAIAMGINVTTLYRKMNGKSEFNRNEIQIYRTALFLTPEEVDRIFFCCTYVYASIGGYMNEAIQTFTHKDMGVIRTMQEEGKVLFCGNDVAKALGYERPKDAVRQHCKGAVKRRLLTSGGEQEMTFIPEPDLYRLICHSSLPKAEKFKTWVFEEVLPSIRKTGSYNTQSQTISVLEYQQAQNAIAAAEEALQQARNLLRLCGTPKGSTLAPPAAECRQLPPCGDRKPIPELYPIYPEKEPLHYVRAKNVLGQTVRTIEMDGEEWYSLKDDCFGGKNLPSQYQMIAKAYGDPLKGMVNGEQVNATATDLYGTRIDVDPVLGDCMIVRKNSRTEGPEGLTEEDIQILKDTLIEYFTRKVEGMEEI